MRQEDLEVLTQIGKALWVNPGRAQQASLETLTAVSLLDLTPERGMEKALSSLCERAARDGIGANVAAVHDPFYRLQSEERLVLSALHLGRWSYPRLGRILGVTPERIQEIAWAARLHLASIPGKPVYLPHPTGSSRGSVSRCPEYHPGRPWTQRFFDAELSQKEKLFLQDHLQGCQGCQQAVNRCRALYFGVEKMIPRAPEKEIAARVSALQATLRQGERLRKGAAPSFSSGLRLFAKRRDVRLVLAGLLALVLHAIFRN